MVHASPADSLEQPARHPMIPFLFALALTSLPEPDLEIQGANLRLPTGEVQEYTSEERTPWGTATRHSWTVDDHKGITYSCSVFEHQNHRTLNPHRLSSARAWFLHDRGCVVQSVKQSRLADGDGRIWPQVTLEGCCEAEEGFRLLIMVVGCRCYWFDVAFGGVPGQSAGKSAEAPGSMEVAPAPPLHLQQSKLDSALRDYVASVQFTETRKRRQQ